MTFINCLLFLLLKLPVFDKVSQLIYNFENSPEMKSSIVSVTVRDCESGSYIINHNGEKTINPASTLKLITTATAFEVLGRDFQFETSIAYNGNVQNGILTGNIYIYGDGDPMFCSERFEKNYEFVFQEITNSLLKMGVSRVEGDLIMMKTEFESYDISDTWAWNDIGNYYGATPHRFNFNENLFKVYFNSTEFGKAATINKISPFSTNWIIINQVTTGEKGSGDNVYIYSTPFSNTLFLKGTIPYGAKNFAVKGAIPNPPQLFGELLKEYLSKKKISVGGKIKLQNYTSEELNPIIKFQSPPLFEVVKQCNFYSVNLIADALVKKIGEIRLGIFNYKNGIAEVQKFWQNQQVITKSLNSNDGSGLSPQGTLTGEVMCSVLAEMSKSKNFQYFLSTIPQIGISGTVSRIGRGTPFAGKVWAKSGTISGTKAFAGYFKTKEGNTMSYMICVNRYNEDMSKDVNILLESLLLEFAQL